MVALNAAEAAASVTIEVPFCREGELVDVLNGDERFAVRDGRAVIAPLHPHWGRVLVPAP